MNTNTQQNETLSDII